jgi:hypothetical protein
VELTQGDQENMPSGSEKALCISEQRSKTTSWCVLGSESLKNIFTLYPRFSSAAFPRYRRPGNNLFSLLDGEINAIVSRGCNVGGMIPTLSTMLSLEEGIKVLTGDEEL